MADAPQATDPRVADLIQKRTRRQLREMTAFPPKTDIGREFWVRAAFMGKPAASFWLPPPCPVIKL